MLQITEENTLKNNIYYIVSLPSGFITPKNPPELMG